MSTAIAAQDLDLRHVAHPDVDRVAFTGSVATVADARKLLKR